MPRYLRHFRDAAITPCFSRDAFVFAADYFAAMPILLLLLMFSRR